MSFIIGVWVGVFVGICLAALMSANGRDEEPVKPAPWQWTDE